MHQSTVTDASTLRGYRQDLAVSKFLSSLSLSLCSQVRGQMLEEIIFSHWLLLSSKLCVYPLELMCHLHHLLNNLPWSPDVAEVVSRPWFWRTWLIWRWSWLLWCDRVVLIRPPDNVSIMGGIISLKNIRRNLITMNGHSWLMLTLLSLVTLLMLLLSLLLVLLVLPQRYFHMLSTIDCVSSSYVRTITQQLMHHLQIWMLILPLFTDLEY